ncbi:winged helix-turn-helix transcriptional regulator [Pistricoccus aurantiacus]|uniref:Winged helix-turn-helix transcriptional regulator n=1 Tax=Pistricoccus aurantiacus TaxID=1883414 RepID=A0A5B8STS6_9GAMM|nr:winged helix-turn-helix domain-containing protein [Pistricoccus aurantiacus]QEA39327.1 winged helix-turn-helix transcriptional regulator [Pistricoccus aurantiacus]
MDPYHISGWTFFSNHTHVLICLVEGPNRTLREVAAQVGITERAVQRIVSDLEEAGIVRRQRVGRRNLYQLFLDKPLRHPLERHKTVKDVVTLITER